MNRFIETRVPFWSNLHMFIRVFHPVNVQRSDFCAVS